MRVKARYSTQSNRLYDIKRGFRRSKKNDATMSALQVFGYHNGKMKFPISSKHKMFHEAKTIFEKMVRYKVDNTNFQNYLRTARDSNLIT